MTRGTLYLVVGPSGAGKDTLIDGARTALAGDPRFVFPTRDITRPAEAGGEAHNAIDLATFETRRAAGAYALSWGAHGLHYGLPAAIEGDLAAGRSVVVNGSRAVLEEARRRFAPVCVVSVTVPEAELRRRLTARGRETAQEIEERVGRAAAFRVAGKDVVEVSTARPVAESLAAFLALLTRSGTTAGPSTALA